MNWQRLTKTLILHDGKINEREAAILKRELLADRAIDREEAEFLIDLRRAATVVHPEFDRFFFEVVRKLMLRDGAISDTEARWLRKVLFSGGAGSGLETKLLEELRRDAKSAGPEFQALCTEFLGR